MNIFYNTGIQNLTAKMTKKCLKMNAKNKSMKKYFKVFKEKYYSRCLLPNRKTFRSLNYKQIKKP